MPTIANLIPGLDLEGVLDDGRDHADDKTPSKDVERYLRPDSKCEVSILSREDYDNYSGDSND